MKTRWLAAILLSDCDAMQGDVESYGCIGFLEL